MPGLLCLEENVVSPSARDARALMSLAMYCRTASLLDCSNCSTLLCRGQPWRETISEVRSGEGKDAPLPGLTRETSYSHTGHLQQNSRAHLAASVAGLPDERNT